MKALKQELLRLGFPQDKLRLVNGSYDLVGDIALLEIPSEAKKYSKLIAAAVQNLNKHVKVVAVKAGATKGKYRVRKARVIAGEKRSSTTHRESGCSFKIDLNKAYFSTRLSHERERIASQVKPGERVLVLFAGVGPFAIIAAKRQPLASFVAVELNPAAVKLLKENIALNKVAGRVVAVKADAKKFCARKENKAAFDRIVMPLPHSAREFLPSALLALKRGGMVHFYSMGEKRNRKGEKLDVFAEPLASIAVACGKKNFRLLAERVVLHYSPFEDEVVIDFRVS
ncbi:MAG: class I SAM-dependent methyltransferase family protein [Candidatus Micrarchaeota archaeon]